MDGFYFFRSVGFEYRDEVAGFECDCCLRQIKGARKGTRNRAAAQVTPGCCDNFEEWAVAIGFIFLYIQFHTCFMDNSRRRWRIKETSFGAVVKMR